jgi:hypothetical protein
MTPRPTTPEVAALDRIASAIDRNTVALDRLGLTPGATLDSAQHATLASLRAQYDASRRGPE